MEVMTTLERQIQRNRRLLDNDPNNVDLMLTYAHDCLRRDLRFEALVTFQKVLEQKESAEARLALAEIFCLQALYPEAYDELRRLFALDPINIGGHVLLHVLNGRVAAPDDLVARLAFVPARSELSDGIIRAQNERDLYRREVQEYESAAASGTSEPEPILLYYAREAQKRMERMNVDLEVMNGWEALAVDIPGFTSEEGKQELGASEKGEQVKPAAEPAQKVAEAGAVEEEVKPIPAVKDADAEKGETESVDGEPDVDLTDEDSRGRRGKKSKRRRGKDKHEGNQSADDTQDSKASEAVTDEAEKTDVVNLEAASGSKDDGAVEGNEVAAEPVAGKVTPLRLEIVKKGEIQPEEGSQQAEVAKTETGTDEATVESGTAPLVDTVQVAESDSGSGVAEIQSEATEVGEGQGTEAGASGPAEGSLEAVDSKEKPADVESVPPTAEELAREAAFADPLASLCKIKGSVKAMVVTGRGCRLAASEGEFVGVEALLRKLQVVIENATHGGENTLLTWVCEGKGASIIVQQIDSSYYLLVEGHAVTLGVLRQRVERCRMELAELC